MQTIITALVAAMRVLEPSKRIGWRHFNRLFRRETLDIHERIYSPLQHKLYDIGRPDLALIVGGATNEIHKPGWNLSVVIDDPAAPNSGDPVRFGNLTGIAMLDEGDGGAGSTETPTYFGPGVYDMTVDDNEGTAIAVGDDIYYHDTGTGTGPVNLNNSATGHDAYFGVAMEVVGANATTLINVMHVPLGAIIALGNNAVDTAQLAALAVETAKIDNGAVTSAKVEASLVRYQDTQLSAAELNAVRATNIEVVAAPGANLAVIPVMVHMFLDHGGTDFVQTNNSDQLALLYNSGSEIGELGSEAQCTTFLEAGADASLFDPLDVTGLVPAANAAIDLDNNGAAEYTNGDGTLSIRVYYLTVPIVAFS